jgi:hypothetical protein
VSGSALANSEIGPDSKLFHGSGFESTTQSMWQKLTMALQTQPSPLRGESLQIRSVNIPALCYVYVSRPCHMAPAITAPRRLFLRNIGVTYTGYHSSPAVQDIRSSSYANAGRQPHFEFTQRSLESKPSHFTIGISG